MYAHPHLGLPPRGEGARDLSFQVGQDHVGVFPLLEFHPSGVVDHLAQGVRVVQEGAVIHADGEAATAAPQDRICALELQVRVGLEASLDFARH